MEFNERLSELRKQRGLTQAELAERLFVSRTAVSKWESGRGYPSIDSLKAISRLFSVTLDELLSSDEAITLAEWEQKREKRSFGDLVFGLLDICALLLMLLPIFAQRGADAIREVSLLNLDGGQAYLRAAYLAATVFLTVFGVLTLSLQNFQATLWIKSKRIISIAAGIIAVLLFTVTLQIYPAILVFSLLVVKMLILLKRA